MDDDRVLKRDRGVLLLYGKCGHRVREYRGTVSPQLAAQIHAEAADRKCEECARTDAPRPKTDTAADARLWD